jgi:hypothetical protein
MTTEQRQPIMQQYTTARRAFMLAVQEAKEQEWDEIAGACDSHTPNNKHKLLHSKYKRTKTSTRVAAASFPDENGAPPRTAEQALSNMAAHIATVSSLPAAATTHFDTQHEEMVREYLS